MPKLKNEKKSLYLKGKKRGKNWGLSPKFYLTTSIAYVNSAPHIGFALELIQADTLARYYRQKGFNVFFLTGTDENAQKNVLAAEKEGVSLKEFLARNASRFKDLTKVLKISNDYFIRTTNQKIHWPGVKKIWQECQKRGDIYKKKYQGLYCVGCEAFLTKKDLVDGKCPYHQKEPEEIVEENYFFRLSKYQKDLIKIIKEDKIQIIPKERKNEILNFIESNLEDLSISRPAERLKGIGIPVPGDKSQKIYVWFDALSNYISAIGYGRDEKNFRKFWPADIHLIGKDILKFHAVYWPAFLLSARLPLPKRIVVHGFITVKGEKMSKSLGNVIDPFELVEKYNVDPVRYYFLRETSPFEDIDFTFEKFQNRYNSDLVKDLGNLVNRVITLASNNKVRLTKKEIKNKEIKTNIRETQKEVEISMNSFKFNEALISIWKLVYFANNYIDKEKPWQKTKDQKEKIENLLFILKEISKLLIPFLPETSKKIENQVKNLEKEILFPKIEN